MIIGIGCDIIEVSRVRSLHLRFSERMEQRMFSEAEQRQAQEKSDVTLRYAKYIAAKEAVYKALPASAQQGFSWKDAQVNYSENGKPVLVLSQKIMATMPDGLQVHLSLSDSDSHALAYVVLED